MTSIPSRRVSASRLNSIEQCTMKYYLNEIVGLPEKIWPRTACGSAVHSVLEAIYRDRHRAHHDAIKAAQSIYASPSVARLVRAWQSKTGMSDEVVADIDPMALVAINHTNFLDEGAIQRFEPEHEFKMTLSNGAEVKGFIDKMARFPDRFVIGDYKSARNKHSKVEVANSYQSLCYQLYVYKTFGALAEVRYYFLRHAPTKAAPTKHLMITPPATPEQLAGFEQYLMQMWEYINRFSFEDAQKGYCSDRFFCERVCSYFKPVRYWTISSPTTNAPIRKIWIDPKDNLDIRPQIKDNEVLALETHPGCARWNS